MFIDMHLLPECWCEIFVCSICKNAGAGVELSYCFKCQCAEAASNVCTLPHVLCGWWLFSTLGSSVNGELCLCNGLLTLVVLIANQTMLSFNPREMAAFTRKNNKECLAEKWW